MRSILRFFNFIIAVVLILGVLIACLPMIMSTEWGKNRVVHFVNQKIQGKIEIRALKLSWVGDQTIEGVALKDPEGSVVAHFEKFYVEASLWQLINKSMTLGKTVLQDLNTSIIIDESGVSNLQKAIGNQTLVGKLPPSTTSLSNVNAELVFDPNREPLAAHLTGSSKQNDLVGSFVVDVVLNQFFVSNWDELSKETEKLLTIEGSKEAKIHVDIKNFPVDFIDQVIALKDPQMESLFHDLIGDRLNLTADKEKSSEGLAFNVTLSSPKMQGDFKGKIEKGAVTLNKPSTFYLKLEPQTINRITNQQLDVQEESTLTVVLEGLMFSLPFLEGLEVDACQLGFKAQLNLSPTRVNGVKILTLKGDLNSPVCDKTIKLTFTGKSEKDNDPYDIFFTLQGTKPTRFKDFENLKDSVWTGGLIASTPFANIQLSDMLVDLRTINRKISAVLTLLKPDGSLNPLLPDPVPFALTTTDSLSKFKLHLDGPTLTGNVEGGISKDILILTQPADFMFLLSPEGLKEIGRHFEKKLPSLLNTAKIKLKVDPDEIELKSLLASLAVKGVVNIDRAALQEESETTVTFENMVIPWAINNQLEIITLKLNGEAFTSLNEKRSRLALRLSTERLFPEGKFNIKNAKFEILAELFGLPTSLISHFIASKDLTPVIGPLVDIELKTAVDMSSESEGYWDMFVDSTNLSAKGRFKIEDSITLYKSNKPTAQIRWTITPEGFEYIKTMAATEEAKHSLTLANPVTLTTFLNELDIPLKKTQSWADQGKIEGEFETTEISWKELPKLHPFLLNGKVNSNNLADQINFAFNGSSHSSSVALQGAISNLFSAVGQVQKVDQINLQTNLEAKQLPLTWFQSLFLITETQQKQVQAVLGDSIDATATIQLNRMNGPIKVNLSGSNGSSKLDGQVNKGILTLNSPFHWQIKVTPQLGKDLLQSNMPLLSSIINSEKPLHLSIDPANFSCPLLPFDLNKLTIGKGTIDFGKVMLKNEGDLRSVLSLIKPIPENQFTIWFTPLYFKLEKGLLTFNRVDLLVANMYTLAAWGNIDLNSNKMDLVLGLSAQSLRYAFNIQGLDESYILQIPIKGRNGKVDVDKAKATARITALIAQSHSDSNVKLLGSLVDMALSSGGAPKPTTNPLPWANEFIDKSAVESKVRQSPGHGQDKGQGQDQSQDQDDSNATVIKKKKKIDASDLLQKGASTLLDKLLK